MLEANANLPDAVSFAPILETDISENVELEPGQYWELGLSVTDPDDDFATVDVEVSGSGSDWLLFDQDSLTIYTTAELEGQTLGTFQVTIVLEDYEANRATNALTITVECKDGNRTPLCYTAEDTGSVETSDSATTIIDGETTTTGITQIDSLLDFTSDYDVVEVLSIEDTVPEADPALEDDEDFVDMPGVLSEEQAAEAMEDIIAQSLEPVVF